MLLFLRFFFIAGFYVIKEVFENVRGEGGRRGVPTQFNFREEKIFKRRKVTERKEERVEGKQGGWW